MDRVAGLRTQMRRIAAGDARQKSPEDVGRRRPRRMGRTERIAVGISDSGIDFGPLAETKPKWC
ncbi:MAG TPA: hypothetical protein VMP01_19960 [Pirellulaceae bacterium]|nr:hypothetical protein [Pirellulaceae bacterium]